MTIALGMFTHFGSIIAADSQEGTGSPGDLKNSAAKISLRSSGFVREGKLVEKTLAVTGAGDSGYLDFLKQKLSDAFGDDPDVSIASFEKYLKSELRTFYKEHVVPFPPAEWGYQLAVKLIVSAQIGNERRMWVTHMNSVRPVTDFAAAGSGESWAKYAWKAFIPQLADEHTASIVAAYAVFVAKENAEGCGKDTKLVSMPVNGFFKAATPEGIRTLETHFRSYEGMERVERWKAMGQQIEENTDFRPVLQTLRSDLANVVLYPPLPQWAQPRPGEHPRESG